MSHVERTLNSLMKTIPCTLYHTDGQLSVSSIEYDSRKVKKNSLFVALRGARTDGHRFLQDAVEKGASVLAVEDISDAPPGVPLIKVEDSLLFLAEISKNFYSSARLPFPLIGVTGTNGKTTVTYILRHLARLKGQAAAVIGTLGVQGSSLQVATGYTTPMSSDLQRILSQLAVEAVQFVFMEASSIAAVSGRLHALSFDMMLFTNLSQDHLDYHGDMENYYLSKRSLFEKLRSGGTAIVNIDDPYGRRLSRELPELHPDIRVLTCSLQSGTGDFSFSKALFSAEGLQAVLSGPGFSMDLKSSLIGQYNGSNALLAAAAWSCIQDYGDMDLDIRDFQGAPGRMEIHRSLRHGTVIVDFAHTPDAMENIFAALDVLENRGSVSAIFGAGGDRDRGKRPLMGAAAAKYCDRIILSSDNPRSEDPLRIIADIAEGIPEGRYSIIPDRVEAIRRALSLAGPNDITLLLGKGGEEYTEIAGRKIPYSDSKTVEEIIREFESA